MDLECTPKVKEELIIHMVMEVLVSFICIYGNSNDMYVCMWQGLVHKTVVDSCEEYFLKMRRHVYQTPKSFLQVRSTPTFPSVLVHTHTLILFSLSLFLVFQFLSDYGSMYKVKAAEIVTKANRVEIGLEKLKSGAKDVEKMKIVLAEEEVRNWCPPNLT